MPEVFLGVIKGPKGDPYVLTDEDKQAIADIVISMLEDGDEVSY